MIIIIDAYGPNSKLNRWISIIAAVIGLIHSCTISTDYSLQYAVHYHYAAITINRLQSTVCCALSLCSHYDVTRISALLLHSLPHKYPVAPRRGEVFLK